MAREPETTPARRDGVLRKLGWSLGTAVAVVLLVLSLLVAGAVSISRGWQRAALVAAIEERLGDALGTEVHVDALRGPLVPSFEALGIRVGPAGSELARARRIAVHWDAETLVADRRLVIDAIEIEGLDLVLRYEPAGGWNLPRPAARPASEPASDEEGDPLPVSVSLGRVHVVDSHIDLAWTSPDSTGALAGGFGARVQDVLVPASVTPVTWGTGSLQLGLERGQLGDTRVERGGVEASLDAVHFLQVTAVGAGGFGEIGLSGRGDLDAWLAGQADPGTRIDLAFDALDVAALIGRKEPETRLVGRAELGVGARTGVGGAPELLFDARIEPSRLGRVPISRARLRGSLLDRAWRLEDLLVEGEGVSVRGSASGLADELQAVDVAAGIERLDRLASWLPGAEGREAARQLAGGVSLELHLTDPAGRPNGSVALDGTDLAWRGVAVGDVALRARIEAGDRAVVERFALRGDRLSLDVDPGAVLRRAGPELSDGVVVEGLHARSEGAVLDVDGGVSAEAARDLRLRLAGLALARLGELEGIATPTAGRVDAAVTLDGPLRQPAATGWLELQDGAAQVPVLGETFAPIAARLRLENETLFVERITVGPPGERAEVTGRVAVPGLRPGRADLHLQVAEFPLTRVPLPGGLGGDEPGAPATTVAAGGHVDADLTLTGPLLAPTVTGDLDWTRPRWEDVQLDRITLHVEGDGRRVEGSAHMRYEGSEILQARASLPIPANPRKPLDWLHDERAHIEVTGDSLDFALLQPFLTRLVREPRGTANVKLVIDGGRPEPRVDGLVTVADGSLRVPLLRRTFEPVSGRARFDGRRVSLESLSIGTADAGLFAEGDLELTDLRPERVDLDVRLDHFPISRSSLLEADVDGQVDLDGPVDAPALTGKLTLEHTRVTVRSERDPIYKEVRVRATGSESPLRERPRGGPDLLDRASVDLALTVPGNTWIRSPEIELDVSGWAQLDKRSLEPLHISGELGTRRGTVRLVGKRFEVRKGDAVLDGSSQPDPVLDVTATHPVADIVIVAHVTGRVSDPILRLESEPALPEEEIVSYLFFGRPTDQLGAGEQGSVSTAAAGIAAGMALDELREIFGHQLPVDTIDVRLNEGDEPSRVEVGKYVTKDVFLRYGHTFGSESVEEVGVSYRIDEHWRVESTTSSNATAGADVYWTIDY